MYCMFLLQIGMCSKKELGQLDTMLPLNPSTDMWRKAHPVTKNTDSMYPFSCDRKRPSINEVRLHLNKIYIFNLLIKIML